MSYYREMLSLSRCLRCGAHTPAHLSLHICLRCRNKLDATHERALRSIAQPFTALGHRFKIKAEAPEGRVALHTTPTREEPSNA